VTSASERSRTGLATLLHLTPPGAGLNPAQAFLISKQQGSGCRSDPSGLKSSSEVPKHQSWLDIKVCNVRRVANRFRPVSLIQPCQSLRPSYIARIVAKSTSTLSRTGSSLTPKMGCR
jgi:hypothetical protein